MIQRSISTYTEKMHLKGTVNDFRETLLLFEIKPKKKTHTLPFLLHPQNA